jgi:hypothetical protein
VGLLPGGGFVFGGGDEFADGGAEVVPAGGCGVVASVSSWWVVSVDWSLVGRSHKLNPVL